MGLKGTKDIKLPPPPKATIKALTARYSAPIPALKKSTSGTVGSKTLTPTQLDLKDLRGTAGSDYANMMNWSVGRGYLPGQLTPAELGMFGNTTPMLSDSTLASLNSAGYAPRSNDPTGSIYGLFLPGSAIGNKMGIPTGDSSGDDNYSVGGGGGGEPAQAKFSDTYKLEGAPSWWKGYTPDVWNPESQYLSDLNAMIGAGVLSGADLESAVQHMARMNPAFADYANPANDYGARPDELGGAQVNQYLGAERGDKIVKALEAMATASGRKKEEFGPGHEYFKQIANTFTKYGAKGNGEGITRSAYREMLGQLDPLLAESSGGSLGAYGSMARMLANPFFTAGQLGNVIFGQANSKFF